MKSLLVPLLTVSVAAAPVAAQTCAPPVGRIERIHANYVPVLNDGFIQRATGARDPLKFHAPLYSGDKIVVKNEDMDVDYSIGQTPPQTVAGGRESQTMPPLLSPSQKNESTCRATPYTQLVLNGPRPTIVQTQARGVDELQASAYLPQGEQWLPPAMHILAPVWQGDASVWVNHGQTAPVQTSFALVTSPKGSAFELEVREDQNKDNELRWQVQIVNTTPPKPEGLTGNDASDDDFRIERALWLLRPGADPHWRLFALSEIASLRENSYTADLAWRQIMNGKYHVVD